MDQCGSPPAQSQRLVASMELEPSKRYLADVKSEPWEKNGKMSSEKCRRHVMSTKIEVEKLDWKLKWHRDFIVTQLLWIRTLWIL